VYVIAGLVGCALIVASFFVENSREAFSLGTLAIAVGAFNLALDNARRLR